VASNAVPVVSDQPALFIGSSSESVDYANALQVVLDETFEAAVWKYGVFGSMQSTLAGLMDRAAVADFAALFLTPDDETIMRGRYLKTPRDNLIFELGLFLGHLGPDRVFLLHPNEQVDLPNDLNGITTLRYRTDRRDKDFPNAVNPAATTIRAAGKRYGPRRQARASDTFMARAGGPIDVLRALSYLQQDAQRANWTVEFEPASDGAEVVIVDRTGLRRSVVFEMYSEVAVRLIEELRNSLSDH